MAMIGILRSGVVVLFWIYCLVSCSEPSQGAISVEISGRVSQAVSDSIGLYDFFANEYRPIQVVKLEKNGSDASFTIKTKAPFEGMYFLAFKIDPQQTNGAPILIGPDPKIRLTASENQFYSTLKYEEGKANEEFLAFLRRTDELQQMISSARMQMQQTMQQGQNAETIRLAVDSLFTEQAQFHQNFMKGDRLINKIARCYYYLPYGAPGTMQKHPDEKTYFINEFLSNIKMNDPTNGYIPVFHQKAFAYASNLMGPYQLPFPELKGLLDAQLKQIPDHSKAKEVFLLGIMGAAAQNQRNYEHFLDAYITYAKQYVDQFPNSSKSARFRDEIAQIGSTLTGSEAPDIILAGLDGKQMRLSSLRGKVVLIDFWASWCGPCRRENPNVVRVYNQYKDKGFTVFSVSLDQDKGKWEEAIRADNLTWPYHVSDLQGWKSEAAKLYGVSAIPKTFLIDRNGIIIGKDLRGEQLERKLAEIFGSN
jgi:thiol-disulfide isomerase/thioredoxin